MRRFLFPGVLLLAGYYALFGGEYSVADVERTRDRLEVATGELAQLQDRTRRLEGRVAALETDPRALEALARERFGMIRAGEVLYRFADGAPAGPDEVDRGDFRR